ncbi:tetratricopeptide repeat protein [Hanstruepera marina]|uniref:tetratricopeptide repeat protein n=1 Tax=Hanstruepera marina TaxID=2873265 RepID=UPI001CA7120B|nr:tetratricopeptide repeat protein [Hanstruepera marina]
MRYLSLILIVVSSFCYGQESVEILIDSLNFVINPEGKVSLSKRIASELSNEDWDKAISYLELAETEAENTENPTLELASIYVAFGDIFYSKDVLDITSEYYQKAYSLYKELGDKSEMSILENNLAIIYAQLKNQDKALEYFRNVYRHQLENNDTLRLAQILNNIGTLHLERHVDSSLYYFNKSLKISERLNNEVLKGYIYTNLGRGYTDQDNMTKARENFNKALTVANNSNNDIVKGFVYQSLAMFYAKTEEHDSAIVYSRKTMDLNKGNFYSFSNQDATSTLYQAYKSKNDYKNAVHYFEQYNKIRDSLNVEEKAVNVERLKLQQEYKVREQIRQLEEDKKRSNYIMIGLGLVTGILFLIILLIKYRDKISKSQLEKKLLEAEQKELRQNLENKNKALIGKAMAEMHRTDIINGILNDLKQVKRKAVKKETQQAIDYILKSLQRDLSSNVWEEFEISFEQVHESFCKALIAKHPDLTPKDRRLCSLLYLDLTSKEIALITGQSFKSVENARTRLRKKLNLTKEKVNLSNYMNSLQ